jgi:hypothetical protein
MPGVLWGLDKVEWLEDSKLGDSQKTFAGVEASGVYHGTLKEDMIDTVRRTGKSFIDVDIEGLYWSEDEEDYYPLTYVPVMNQILALTAGTQVWVRFAQDNLRYPVFWKLKEPTSDAWYGQAGVSFTKDEDPIRNFPDGGSEVEYPEAQNTKFVHKLSDNFWVIGTDGYLFLHNVGAPEQDLVFSSRGTLLSVSEFQVLSRGDITFESSGAGRYHLNNGTQNFADLLSDICDLVAGLSTVDGKAMNPASITKAKALQVKLGQLWR